MIIEDALNIFTDGSSMRSPRTGGIGIRFVTIDPSGNEQVRDVQFLGYKNGTNNQMELQACIEALKEAMRLQLTSNVNRIIIYTDSIYVVDNYKKAMFEWPKTKWLLRSKRPVLNADSWKEFVRCIKKTRKFVEIKWIKAHSNIRNKAAHRMARESARKPYRKPLSIVHVRKKLSSEEVDIGSVGMEGQRVSIHVITCQFLNVQKLWKCKYEVISKKSKYHGNVDIIFSEYLLKAGHSYYVRFNDDTPNPRIAKVFREISS